MIAHLPLTSHPNPKKVLVIGGGDGGVVREVLKHESVEEVVLCDIDEVSRSYFIHYIMLIFIHISRSQAVIRVSKQFLPHMSSLLKSPKVTVHIGDGFKFLAANTSTYDDIITDSSDPVGPAAPLFKKPYFQLIYLCSYVSFGADWLHHRCQSCWTGIKDIFEACFKLYLLQRRYP